MSTGPPPSRTHETTRQPSPSPSTVTSTTTGSMRRTYGTTGRLPAGRKRPRVEEQGMFLLRRRVRLALLPAALLGAGLAVLLAPTSSAAPNQFVTMADGVEIALNVRLPDGYEPGKKYPTLFEMSGYDGGSAEDGTLSKDFAAPFPDEIGSQFPLQEDSRQLSRRFDQEYVTVHASARGTGCSGGEFDLFSTQAALDGK